MSCPPFDQVSAYADEMLAPAARREFEMHMRHCTLCQGRLAQITGLRRDLQALPSPALGVDLAARLGDRWRPPAPPPTAARGAWWRWAPAGLAVAAAMASGLWLGGLLLGGGVSVAPAASARVFDPVPPGGLCAAAELCHLSKGSR